MLEAAYEEPPPSEVDAEPQWSRAEELRKEWGVEPGQLWRLGEHLLLCGDCTDPDDVQRLMGDDRAVLFSTDPPYLVDYDGSNHAHTWNKPVTAPANTEEAVLYEEWDSRKQGEDLFLLFMETAVQHAITLEAPWYCWHASVNRPLVEAAWDNFGVFVHQEIVWVKDRAILTRAWYLWQHEPCLFGWVRGKKSHRISDEYPSTVWSFPTFPAGAEVDHPTSKPVELFMIPMLQHTRIGEICYEPFSGSGSQIIAAERLGRICRAIEINPGYVAVQLQRYLDATDVRPELVTEP
jgi:DNA modification methylase